MSFILDALRRAEAERERDRGQVPGLHTPALTPAAPVTGPGRWTALWPWAMGTLLLVGGGLLGAWLRPEPATSASAVAHSGVVLAEAPAAPQPQPQPQPQPLAQQSLPLGLPSPGLAPSRPARALASVPPASTGHVAPPPKAPPNAAPEPPAALAALPTTVRQTLPKLAINGSVYSDDRASRFLILNGEVVHEGAQVAPDCVLEQILPHDLVLNCKGLRYRQPL